MEQAKPLVNQPTTPQIPVNQPASQVNAPSSNKPILKVLLVILLIVLFSLGTYFIVKSQTKSRAPISSSSTTQPSSTQPSMVIPSPSFPVDPTANWKTYTNTQYGYSLKYPVDWQYKEREKTNAAQEVWFGNKNLENIITFHVNKDKYLSSGEKVTCLQRGGKEIMVGENKGLIEYLPGGQNPAQDFVCFEKGGISYEFQHAYSTIVDSKNLFNQILSTFKFLD